MHWTAEGRRPEARVQRPAALGWEWATHGGHSKLGLVGHTADFCPQQTASGIWETSGTLPALSRLAVNKL